MLKLTEAHFSMLCSYIAKNAAAWAGDILTLPERHARAADPANVARFTDEIRGKLDRLDELAGRQRPAPSVSRGGDLNIMDLVSDYGRNPSQVTFKAIYLLYLHDCEQAALAAAPKNGEAG